MFPIEKYKVNSLLSIINKHTNRHNEARRFAELAEQSANAETSGLRYHKYLGIVKDQDTWLEIKMYMAIKTTANGVFIKLSLDVEAFNLNHYFACVVN